MEYSSYERVLIRQLWSWADHHHANDLRSRNRESSPVLRPESASNVLLVRRKPTSQMTSLPLFISAGGTGCSTA